MDIDQIQQGVKKLLTWCNNNFITIVAEAEDAGLFVIPGFGRVFLYLPLKGKIIDEEMFFVAPDSEESTFIETLKEATNLEREDKIDYFVFEFGEQFYYCKPVFKKDTFNEERFVVDFNDLKYVGKYDLTLDLPHLGVHTEYELLNGSNYKGHVKKAKFLGQQHLGICDKNTLAGTLAFQMECQKAGINSILGVTYDIIDDLTNTLATYEVKLYIKDEQGWQNALQLNKLLKITNNGEYIYEKDLFKYSHGLICVFTRLSHLDLENKGRGINKILRYQKDFKGELYFQIDTVEFYDEKVDTDYLNYLQYYFKYYLKVIPPVLINDSYYADPDQFYVKEYLNKLSGKAHDYSENQHYKTPTETLQCLRSLFKNKNNFDTVINFAIVGINSVIEKCKDFKLVTGVRRFPAFEHDYDLTNEELLLRLCEKGFKKKILTDKTLDHNIYLERLTMEFGVIREGGLIDYTLMQWDIIKWCNDSDIYVGTGRGSVAGSLVYYLIGVTGVDPIKYDLLFSRFLNEIRIKPMVQYELPDKKIIDEKDYDKNKHKQAKRLLRYRPDSADVDSDFQSEYREVVKEYIRQRYGVEHVCNVGAFGRLKLKGCIKDFGRIKGLGFQYLNYITSKIDNQHEYVFRDFVEYALKDAELKKFFQAQPEIINVTKFTLGQPKTYSIHASAVLVLPKQDENGKRINIYNQLPVHAIDGLLVSEYEGKYTDASGFLKNDILGLNQLDKFHNIVKLVQKDLGIKINLEKIPEDDKKVYRLFQKGYNEDVFQFNSIGLKSYSRLVKPDNFEDLIAMAALFRPATMQMETHKEYADIKHGKKKVKYDFGLRSVTEKTHGLLIYQEQMMQYAIVLGGFSAEAADVMRTSVKKFDKKVMESFENEFLKGAIKNNCPTEEAKKIWNKIVAFAGYTFNKSHSAAYSKISYRSQWLKVHYPLQFWTTSLQFAAEEEIPRIISEMRKVNPGIKLKPPSVNFSTDNFVCDVDTNSIYWSLQKIKGIGVAVVNGILNNRKSDDLFKSYDDFVSRVPKKAVNRKILTTLIISGCFDECENIKFVQNRIELLRHHCKTKEIELSDEFKLTENIKKPYFWILKQKTLTGYGSVDYASLLKEKRLQKMYRTAEQFTKCREYEEVALCGRVEDILERKTKKKDIFYVAKLVSNDDLVTVLFWNSWLEINDDNAKILQTIKGKQICVTGTAKWDNYAGQNSLSANEETEIILL